MVTFCECSVWRKGSSSRHVAARGSSSSSRHVAARGSSSCHMASTLPFTVGKTRLETNKRAVTIQFHGGKGTTLTLSCSYFKNIQHPYQKHEDFYNYLSRDVPTKDNKHLYIDMGDKNCVIDGTTQRFPPIPNGEPNKHLHHFMRKHELKEIITTQHKTENNPIYTPGGSSSRQVATRGSSACHVATRGSQRLDSISLILRLTSNVLNMKICTSDRHFGVPRDKSIQGTHPGFR